MAQAVLVYLIVAAAAAWVLWSILLPRKARARLRALLGGRGQVAGRAAAAPEDGACGDGGCDNCS